MFARRLACVMMAAAIAAPLLADSAFAQATVGPAGGINSTTAPSNSEGTPSGGTGNIGTTRVGPSDGRIVLSPQPADTAPAPRATMKRKKRTRGHARRAPRARAVAQ